MNLTPKQKNVFVFIKNYFKHHDTSPTYEEIRGQFGFRSINSVTKHIKQLVAKEFITVTPNISRGISLADGRVGTQKLKLFGSVAAGVPIEAIENFDYHSVPEELLGTGEYFCLRVKGDSMIGDGIHDGDLAVINQKNRVNNGEIAVVKLENEVTLKRLYRTEDAVELRSSNKLVAPIFISNGQVEVIGVLKGIIRKY